MSRIEVILIRLMLIWAVAAAQTSCTPIWEDQEECCQPCQKFRLTLHYESEYTDTIHYQARSAAGIEQRVTVYAYKQTGESRSHSRTGDAPDQKFEFTFGDLSLADRQLDVTLTLGTWDLYVWTDYVDSSTGYAYYDTSNFTSITLNSEDYHHGCDDFRDAFRGSADVSINEQTLLADDLEVTVNMKRPLAKYKFVTTDINEFISSQGGVENIDLSRYTVRFYYTGFMPCDFNVFTDRPSDATTGVWYDGYITKINDSEAEIGFDYVMTTGNDTSISVAVAVYDRYGQQISVSSPFDVPISRDYVTVVRGKFLIDIGICHGNQCRVCRSL